MQCCVDLPIACVTCPVKSCMSGFEEVSHADLRHESKHSETAKQEHGAKQHILREDMNGWMDGWMDGRTDRRTDGWWTNRQLADITRHK